MIYYILSLNYILSNDCRCYIVLRYQYYIPVPHSEK